MYYQINNHMVIDVWLLMMTALISEFTVTQSISIFLSKRGKVIIFGIHVKHSFKCI